MILKNTIMKRSESHVGTVFQFGDNVCMKGEQHAHAQRIVEKPSNPHGISSDIGRFIGNDAI